MDQQREILISFNPRAGRGAGKPLIQDLRELLEQRGYRARLVDSLESLRSYAAEHKGRIHAVVAAGGDGTIEAVANATRGEVPIAVFPLGTENLLAKYLKIEAHPRQLLETISLGRSIQFDAGKANDQLFSIVLSCGYDAEVVRRVHEQRKGNITHLAYAQPIINSIFSYEFPGVIVEWEADGSWHQRECHWAFVFNLPTYAAGLQVIDDADPTDGMLDIATFSGGSLWQGLRQFGAVVFGQHHALPDFERTRSNHLRITPVEPEKEIAYQIDGDPGGVLPVEIKVLPQHLSLLVDASFKI